MVLDEAQNIKNIGKVLKILVDTFPEIQIIATGSSSFELASKVNEPLTGRSAIHMMFPVAYGEAQGGAFDLESALVYGMYPEVFLQKSTNEKRNAIERIADYFEEKKFGSMVSLQGNKIVSVPLEEATGSLKLVPKEFYELTKIFF